MRNGSDDILLDTFKAEQENLFRLAYYKTGNADDARDVVQDLFVKVYSQRLAIHDPTGYLYRSLLNACVSLHRSKRGVTFVPLVEDVCDEERRDNFNDECVRISNLLREIPQEQTEVITLHTIGGKNFKEIASILGIPLPTVKSRFKYGIDKLRKLIAKNAK